MIAPRSFYASVGPFPPYSRHLVHDIGAFQIGLGGGMVAGLLVRDGLSAVLAANALGGVAHFVSHLIDRAHGGHAGDPFTIGALGAVLVVLTVARVATAPRPTSTHLVRTKEAT